MALDKTFSVGEVLNAADVNNHLLGLWIPIDKRVITSGSPVTSISFQSIDSNFRRFRLAYDLKASTNEIHMRFNNDSGTNYKFNFIQSASDSSDPFNFVFTSQDKQRVSSNSGVRVVGEMHVGKVTSGVAAMLTASNVNDLTSSLIHQHHYGLWNNTSALINRIDFIVTAGNMHGLVSLEGMRGS